MIKSSLKTQPFTFACFLLAVSLTFFACSGDDSGGGNNDGEDIKTEKERISGVSQKGPFVKGSSVNIYELDSILSQTGQRTYTSTIIDDKGTFEAKDIQLVSSYVLLEANGFYRNEVSGEKSTAPIQLLAVADIADKNNINVNLLTHLEYNRVLNLFKEGKSFSEAKEQAQQEVLDVFGINGEFSNSEDMSIFGTSESDAALLAISILLQGERKEADFSELLTEFSQAIKEQGKWEDVVKKAEIADWANSANLEQIRNNILGWGLSSEVPAFEKYVKSFWYSAYGLGACDAGSEGVIQQNTNTASVNKDVHYICENGEWSETLDYMVCNAENFGERVTMWDGITYTCKNDKWIYDPSPNDWINIYCFETDNCDTWTDNNGKIYQTLKTETKQVLFPNDTINALVKTWAEATTTCPDGWHLPESLDEVNMMLNYIINQAEQTEIPITIGGFWASEENKYYTRLLDSFQIQDYKPYSPAPAHNMGNPVYCF